MNRRCQSHGEVAPLEGMEVLLLPGWELKTIPRPGGWRERRQRRRILQVNVQTFQMWTCGSRKAAGFLVPHVESRLPK